MVTKQKNLKMEDGTRRGYTDLHLHLGSSATANTLWELAHIQGIVLPKKDYWEFLEFVRIDHNIGWEAYHNYFDVVQNIQSSTDAIERSVHEAISLAYRKSDVNLIEIRLNPMRRNRDRLYDLDRIIFNAIVAMKRAEMIYPIKAGLILEMDRRFSPEKNKIIAQKAMKFVKDGVVGLDISGPNDENFEMSQIVDITQEAKASGLGITIHTGERTGVKEMEYVIKNIQPHRIGHGIACVKNQDLMDKIREKEIILEICPTSNVLLGNVDGWDGMKKVIRTLIDNQIKFSINSDSPVLLETNVKKEYKKLVENKILTLKEAKEINQKAYDFSFLNLLKK